MPSSSETSLSVISRPGSSDAFDGESATDGSAAVRRVVSAYHSNLLGTGHAPIERRSLAFAATPQTCRLPNDAFRWQTLQGLTYIRTIAAGWRSPQPREFGAKLQTLARDRCQAALDKDQGGQWLLRRFDSANGHRGGKHDPLYQIHNALRARADRLTARSIDRLVSTMILNDNSWVFSLVKVMFRQISAGVDSQSDRSVESMWGAMTLQPTRISRSPAPERLLLFVRIRWFALAVFRIA